ncbi:group III truncated hemoglobin [Methylobacterium sp.]|uniref:group III truncated hemoglobin n=1 Tax=Methylobacterium sp. TaxID=409 RepID=UPI003B02AF41
MPHDPLTEATLRAFLEVFYAKVRNDPLIGPVFARAIPDADWPRHLSVIQDFWSSVLLRSGRYKGNPFAKHQGLDELTLSHFGRWLALFEQVAGEEFCAEIATTLIERAYRIGHSLKSGLFFRPGIKIEYL